MSPTRKARHGTIRSSDFNPARCVLILGMRRICLPLLFRSLGLPILFCAVAATSIAQQPAPVEAPSPQAAPAPTAVPAEFAEARKLMQQGKVDEAIAELQNLE